MIEIYTATEDKLSEAVADQLIEEHRDSLRVSVRIGGHGSGYLKSKLLEFYRVAEHVPVLMLVDLDRIECPPVLKSTWIGKTRPPKKFLFRIAAREVEAWLLADREGFSSYFNIPIAKIPQQPEILDDPKQHMLSLVWRYSKQPVKSDVVHKSASGLKQGFAYNDQLVAFVSDYWDITRASQRSSSLARARMRLSQLYD